ncbi:hypothetical protein G3N55_11415 [Dissulfurirhabdus thermomarina]|uniref:Cytochrome b/b6 N-terminal region profile domain-containing protein n=1 Tax=Dissulfurirhabdus thermomarina TaxID=1765737 RepID=A0A6N9TVJ5_DISTH|nr:cytochrome b N-terminal domain-containing protein [Dissulfurirhabdus thermomarina]NDY43447.1 hypothetical protein [Dissulfurirhabdus thermomarina]NMX22633.1 hypothetical protein [Dissulfurirhabdus thermomarina]
MSRRWGELATAALLVSAGSGFVVAYHYEAADAFGSAVAIDALLPFGGFWRALHFYSSQAFVLLLLVHTWQMLDEATLDRQHNGRWWLLVALLPMGVLALFTGYVLRADATGLAAGAVAEHLALAVPVAGPALDRLLFAVSLEGLNRVYVVHYLLTALLWGLGTWYHTRRVLVGRRELALILGVTGAAAALVRAPMDAPGAAPDLIHGPWFFLAVQELLRHLPPLAAGVVYPAVPVAALGLMPLARARRPLWWLLGLWGASYLVLTAVAWLR